MQVLKRIALWTVFGGLLGAVTGTVIGRQFVPDVRELDRDPRESADPIGDEAHSPVAGVVHRYHDRVLLKVTHTCAVYCRF